MFFFSIADKNDENSFFNARALVSNWKAEHPMMIHILARWIFRVRSRGFAMTQKSERSRVCLIAEKSSLMPAQMRVSVN